MICTVKIQRNTFLPSLGMVLSILLVDSARVEAVPQEPSGNRVKVESARTMLAKIAALDGSDEQRAEATSRTQKVLALPAPAIEVVLNAFKGATPRGQNWLRAIASDVADNGEFPADVVMKYYQDRSNDLVGRYVAYQLLTDNGADPSELLADAATDPSLPIRYLKIKSLLEEANVAEKTGQKDQAIEILRNVVTNGRSPNQLEKAAKSLKELGEKVDLAASLGMIRKWQVIGPFDNTDSKDFDTAYTPEQRYLSDGNPVTEDAEKGKNGSVSWQSVKSDSELGMVDLNAPLKNEKDAAAYAFTRITVSADDTGPAVVRLGCITANKVWVNGKLAFQNEVYHSGSRIDQYDGPCELVAGENTILVKVLQNAQTEPWAQDWEFQIRLTNPAGDAIKAQVK